MSMTPVTSAFCGAAVGKRMTEISPSGWFASVQLSCCVRGYDCTYMWLVVAPGIRVCVCEPHSVSRKATCRGLSTFEMSTIRMPSLLMEVGPRFVAVLLQVADCLLFE